MGERNVRSALPQLSERTLGRLAVRARVRSRGPPSNSGARAFPGGGEVLWSEQWLKIRCCNLEPACVYLQAWNHSPKMYYLLDFVFFCDLRRNADVETVSGIQVKHVWRTGSALGSDRGVLFSRLFVWRSEMLQHLFFFWFLSLSLNTCWLLPQRSAANQAAWVAACRLLPLVLRVWCVFLQVASSFVFVSAVGWITCLWFCSNQRQRAGKKNKKKWNMSQIIGFFWRKENVWLGLSKK